MNACQGCHISGKTFAEHNDNQAPYKSYEDDARRKAHMNSTINTKYASKCSLKTRYDKLSNDKTNINDRTSGTASPH